MPMVPLPFVVALLLGILLLRMRRGDEAAANRWMTVLVTAYAVQAVLLGLHWGYGFRWALPFQSVMAATLAPLSWLGFRSFVTVNRHAALHALPSLLVAGLWLWAPWLIDLALAVIFLGYGTALLHVARRGPDALGRATLDGAIPLSHALWATAIMLIVSPAIDLAIIAALDALMRERALHHDPNLSLERLARRMGLPARTVSSAINRVRAMNVSQYVNGHRIADACRLLAATNAPITQILLDVGFQTKSNFNREFLRVTGLNPSAWRQQAVRQSATSGSPAAASR